MQTLLVLIMCTVIVFLGFGLEPVHGYDQNNVYIQSIKISPSILKIGNTFAVTATLVNNSTMPIIIDGGTCSTNLADASFVTILFDNHVIIKTENLNCAGAGVSQILNPGKNITQTSPGHGSDYIAAESGTANVTVSFSYHVVNQTDSGQPGFSQKLSKSMLFAISDNNTVHATRDKVPSPLEQFKSGIAAKDVKCRQDLVLVSSLEDGRPACAAPLAALRLYSLGWGYVPAQSSTVDLLDSKISGGDVTGYQYDIQSTSIIIKIQTMQNGSLSLVIPQALLDKGFWSAENHVVLADGKVVQSQEGSTPEGLHLVIPFENETQEIELIGSFRG